jgi:hypothetical protein
MESNPLMPPYQDLEPRAEVESAYPIYKTGASPSMLAGHIWCGVRDSNPCPKIGNLRSWPLDEPSTKMERERERERERELNSLGSLGLNQ